MSKTGHPSGRGGDRINSKTQARPRKKPGAHSASAPLNNDDKLAVIETVARSFEVRDRTKVEIRHLPPRITAADFLCSLRDVGARNWGGEAGCTTDTIMNSILWMKLVPGRKFDALDSAPSVAYLQFASSAAAAGFIKLYQGHSFLDPHGTDYKVTAGLAASQRVLVPPEHLPGHEAFVEGRPDTSWPAIKYYESHPEALTRLAFISADRKIGRLADDPEYLAFLERLKAPKPLRAPISADVANTKHTDEEIVSPLVQALMERKQSGGQRQLSKRHTVVERRIIGKLAQTSAPPVAGPSVTVGSSRRPELKPRSKGGRPGPKTTGPASTAQSHATVQVSPSEPKKAAAVDAPSSKAVPRMPAPKAAPSFKTFPQPKARPASKVVAASSQAAASHPSTVQHSAVAKSPPPAGGNAGGSFKGGRRTSGFRRRGKSDSEGPGWRPRGRLGSKKDTDSSCKEGASAKSQAKPVVLLKRGANPTQQTPTANL